MTQYKINIGLDNTTASKVTDKINQFRGYFYNNYSLKFAVGQYKGKKENTAILSFKSDKPAQKILDLCKNWAGALNQDCIAVAICSDYLEGVLTGSLVYSSKYSGRLMAFDENLFLT